MNTMRFPLSLLYVCFACLQSGCVAYPKDLIYKDNLVMIYQTIPRLPHGAGVESLEVAGRTFDHLYSFRYVLIPTWNSIVFVTHKDGGKYDVHIFDLTSKTNLIAESSEPFGSGFGGSTTNRSGWRLKEVEGNKATLVTSDRKGKELQYELDRVQGMIRRLD